MGSFVTEPTVNQGSTLDFPSHPMSIAGGLVATGWTDAHNFALAAVAQSSTFLAQLGTAAASLANLPTVSGTIDKIALDVSGLDTLLGTMPVAPSTTAQFVEVPYSSAYLTDLRVQLDSWVTGKSTGLAPAVEMAIYDRGRARELAAGNAKSQEIIRSYAMRGFSTPQEIMKLELADTAQSVQDNLVTISRDIMTKQADLEQANRHFAFEQAWKVEQAMIEYTSQQMNRALDMVKVLNGFFLGLYEAQTHMYGVGAQVYSAKVGAMTTIFKAEVDANIAEANLRVEVAKANIQSMIEQVRIVVEAMKSGAAVTSQLAASALSSVNLSGQLSDHNATSTSLSNSNGHTDSTQLSIHGQISESHTYNEK